MLKEAKENTCVYVSKMIMTGARYLQNGYRRKKRGFDEQTC